MQFTIQLNTAPSSILELDFRHVDEIYIAGVCTRYPYELMILILITDAHRFWQTTMFKNP